ncbi:MAG: terpene cyclase/mutase family protein [Aureliella sp.]
MKLAIFSLALLAATVFPQVGEAKETSHQDMVNRSVEFLRSSQADDGSFSGKVGLGPTGLVVTGLLASGVSADDPMVTKGLKYLQSHVQPSGGIHKPESLHRNYATCIAMMAFARANESGKYDALLSRAETFVKGIQWDASEGKSKDDPFWGGAGYGSHSRPDMSNTSYLIDALHDLGRGSDDEAMLQALAFISRCQNLDTKHNQSEFADKIGDGGFYYTVAAGGESKAGVEENGGLRSYGSMTYAGLKSMIYAGVSKDDRRVTAAIEFLRKNYDLESNPGVGQQGLYYYYHTMAKAFDAVGQPHFVDAAGEKHDWKTEIRNQLAKAQRDNGSWVNDTTRWMEGDPNLVCGYALLALSYCKPDGK